MSSKRLSVQMGRWKKLDLANYNHGMQIRRVKITVRMSSSSHSWGSNLRAAVPLAVTCLRAAYAANHHAEPEQGHSCMGHVPGSINHATRRDVMITFPSHPAAASACCFFQARRNEVVDCADHQLAVDPSPYRCPRPAVADDEMQH